jgi:hypothetical protein
MSLAPVSGGATPALNAAPIAPIAPIGGSGASAVPTPAPAAPNGPAAALAQMIGEAAVQQDGLAALLADLPAAAATPELPSAAQGAAAQIVATQTPLTETATAADVRAAAQNSGVLLEASLAQLAGQPGGDPSGLGADLKALLLQLTTALAPADGTPAPPRATASTPPPPTPGGPLSGQQPTPPTIAPGASAHQVAHALSAGAHAALARLQLSQAASLQSGGLFFEAPVATPNGTAVAQFQIGQDGGGSAAAGGASATWRAKFSVDAPPSGPVHAELSLSGGRLRVTLTSQSEAARQALQAGQAELTGELAGGEADDIAVRFVTGAPAPAPAGVGRFVDRQT